MSGMNTTGTTGLSNYNSRILAIEVTGLCCQDVSRTSNYMVKVPYSRMSQAMQRIKSMGGKVASVTVVSSLLAELAGVQELLDAGISPPVTYYHVNEAAPAEHSSQTQSAEPVSDAPVPEAVAAEHSSQTQSAEPVSDAPVPEAVAAEFSSDSEKGKATTKAFQPSKTNGRSKRKPKS